VNTPPTSIEPGAFAGDTPAESFCSTCNRSFAPELDRCPDDGTRLVQFAAQRDPLVGRTLEGRFEVLQPLGKGGMGTVYRALQLSVDREVAVKVVHPRLASDRQAAKRFLREARLASRLNQPSVVHVIDFGQTEDGVLYLVMELLRGRTLQSELGGDRRFSVRRALTIGLQLCDALEAAHAQGIVHRDLKPGNVVVLDDPPGRDLIKVLDFGLAKSLAGDTSQVTNTDAILGTPLYMSPEQVQGKPSDQRADLYSLGCMLFELLTGAPPFLDESVNVVMARHLGESPPPLPPHVPPRLRTLIEQLLAKDPDLRVQTAGEVRAVMQWVIDSGALVGAPAAAAADGGSASDTVPDVDIELAATAALERTSAARLAPAVASASMASQPALSSVIEDAPPRSSRRALVLLALVLAAALAIAIVAMTRSRDRGPAGGGGGAPIDAAMPTVAVPAAAADAAPPLAPPRTVDAETAVDAGVRPPRDAALPVPDAGRSVRPRLDGGVTGPRPIPFDAGAAATRPRPIDAAPDIDFYPSRPR
jgi:serine/threonine-protein kinase